MNKACAHSGPRGWLSKTYGRAKCTPGILYIYIPYIFLPTSPPLSHRCMNDPGSLRLRAGRLRKGLIPEHTRDPKAENTHKIIVSALDTALKGRQQDTNVDSRLHQSAKHHSSSSR